MATSRKLSVNQITCGIQNETSQDEKVSSLPAVPKRRSGLAFAAGHIAIAYVLITFSLIPWLRIGLSQYAFDLKNWAEMILAIFFLLAFPVLKLPAPIAFWLGIKACLDLKRYSKSGWLPAAIALIIGFSGTVFLLNESYEVFVALRAITSPCFECSSNSVWFNPIASPF